MVDGGSTDGSVAILERWSDRLSYWTSAPDGGQYDAINRGFARTTGDVMGWLNADDHHLPWTLSLVGEMFERFPEIDWLTTQYPLTVDESGRAVQTGYGGGFNADAFRRGGNLPGRGWFATGFVQQESTFWRRSLWEKAGGRVDASLKLAGDFELWCRFFDHAPLYAVAAPLAAFRRHPGRRPRHASRPTSTRRRTCCAVAASARTGRSKARCGGRSGPASAAGRWCGCHAGRGACCRRCASSARLPSARGRNPGGRPPTTWSERSPYARVRSLSGLPMRVTADAPATIAVAQKRHPRWDPKRCAR